MPEKAQRSVAAAKSIVAEVLLDRLDPETVESLIVLAGLEYPIPDRLSLKRQLAGLEASADPKWPAWRSRLLVGAFRATDFGLDSPAGALEKFTARIPIDPPVPDLGEIPPAPEDDSPPDLEVPELQSPRLQWFGSGPCGRAAVRLFSRLVRQGMDARQALRDARAFEGRCNATLPFTPDIFGCGGLAQSSYADCLAAGGTENRCRRIYERARQRCIDRRTSVDVPPDLGRIEPRIELDRSEL